MAATVPIAVAIARITFNQKTFVASLSLARALSFIDFSRLPRAFSRSSVQRTMIPIFCCSWAREPGSAVSTRAVRISFLFLPST